MYKDDRRLQPWALLAVSLIVGAGAGRSHASDPPPMDRQRALAATRLEARSDADSLATAANLRFIGEPGAALRLATRAVQAEPSRPELLWLVIGICQARPDCSSAVWEAQLERLDPANAAPYLAALRRTTLAADSNAQQAALAAFANSERLDLYWTPLVFHGVRALTQTGAMSLLEAEVSVIGTLTAIMPPFAPISGSCKDAALDVKGSRERCRQTAGTLQRGDTVIAEMIGVAIAKRVWPEDSAEWRAADAARRAYDYRTGLLAQQPLWIHRHPRQYLTLLQTSQREQDLMRQQIVLMGLPPDPPAT